MADILHPIQQKIYDLIKKGYQDPLSLREIAILIGEKNHQNVAHHIKQLEKKGYLRKNPQNAQEIEVLKDPVENAVYLNVFGFAQCGPSGLLAQDNIFDKVIISSKMFGMGNSDDFFCVKARGESMEPQIYEKDLVIAKKQMDVENNQIAIIVHNEMPKIKKILKTGDNIVLFSLNPSFSPEQVKDNDTFQIYGLVKHVIRFNVS
ncbi:MAG: S24 family peptidase [bacterium]